MLKTILEFYVLSLVKKIGDPNYIFYTDEILVSKRKNRGIINPTEQKWIVDALNTDNKELFIVEVTDWTEELWQIPLNLELTNDLLSTVINGNLIKKG